MLYKETENLTVMGAYTDSYPLLQRVMVLIDAPEVNTYTNMGSAAGHFLIL